ncbi:MAG: GntR family transcriptional regulator [Cryobacterium sp.]|nr:GntR family transcriptional regulator [Cryobacterium sp.]
MFEFSPGTASTMERTLADRVTAQLHRLILQGTFSAGEALRIEDLAKRFDTSSMPVREALRRLAALGLVDLVPHRGARVMDLSREDLEDTFRTRLALEPLAIAEAAKRFTHDDGLHAAAALERHERLLAAEDVDGARTAHTEFHFILYGASGSRWLLRAIEPVWQNTERYRFSTNDARTIERSHREHANILQACRVRDSRRAKSALREHLDNAMKRMVSALAPGHEH